MVSKLQKGLERPEEKVVLMEPRSVVPNQELRLERRGLQSRCLNGGETQPLQHAP